MKTLAQDIYDRAQIFNPCDKLTGAETDEALAELFLSPQGLEFCVANDFPQESDFCRVSAALASQKGIYINEGLITLRDPKRVAVIGSTYADIDCSTTEHSCTIAVLKGAKVHVRAHGYAVVRIIAQAGCEYTIDRYDNAVVWHGKEQ